MNDFIERINYFTDTHPTIGLFVMENVSVDTERAWLNIKTKHALSIRISQKYFS